MFKTCHARQQKTTKRKGPVAYVAFSMGSMDSPVLSKPFLGAGHQTIPNSPNSLSGSNRDVHRSQIFNLPKHAQTKSFFTMPSGGILFYCPSIKVFKTLSHHRNPVAAKMSRHILACWDWSRIDLDEALFSESKHLPALECIPICADDHQNDACPLRKKSPATLH